MSSNQELGRQLWDETNRYWNRQQTWLAGQVGHKILDLEVEATTRYMALERQLHDPQFSDIQKWEVSQRLKQLENHRFNVTAEDARDWYGTLLQEAFDPVGGYAPFSIKPGRFELIRYLDSEPRSLSNELHIIATADPHTQLEVTKRRIWVQDVPPLGPDIPNQGLEIVLVHDMDIRIVERAVGKLALINSSEDLPS